MVFKKSTNIKPIILTFILLWVSGIFKAQNNRNADSIALELKKIKETNQLLQIKDSIRTGILKDGLANIVDPKSKELNKYKTELLKIRAQDSLRLEKQKRSIDALRAKIQPHSVQLFHKTLFNIYSGLGPFSAKDRAITAQNQIEP